MTATQFLTSVFYLTQMGQNFDPNWSVEWEFWSKFQVSDTENNIFKAVFEIFSKFLTQIENQIKNTG